MNELIHKSATALARAIRNKEVSSEEVVKACLERIKRVNPQLNAVVQLTADQALTQARNADAALARGEISGPLHGIPITIKDNLDTAGVISTGGTKGRASFVPQCNATVVERLLSAGAILMGKTNTPELTLAYETDNLVYGRTNNPYDLSRSCGGSSGGAAAIIAAGGSPLDIGSDTGGSIRLPSHFCGTAGIRPTSGRVPRTGHILPPGGALDSLTQLGPMARFVEDLALTLPIVAGEDWHDPAIIPMPLADPGFVNLSILRVAFHTENGIVPPTPEIVDTTITAAKILSDAGLIMEETRPPGIEQSLDIYLGLVSADGGAGIRSLLQMYGTSEPHSLTRQILESPAANRISAAEFGDLLARWDMFRSDMLSFMENYDVILSPVCAFPALPHDNMSDTDRFSGFSYTMTYNLTGWPSAVVRAGTTPGGLPIGIQVTARPWREDVALAVCQYIERSLGPRQTPLL